MFTSWLDRSLAFLLTVCLVTATANAWPYRHSVKKARIHFLAESILIRGTWGWNEDIYLTEVRFSKQDESVLVRLVDAYPNEVPPLSCAALTAESGSSFCVKRDQQCDSPFGAILLRAVPGDAMAVLPVKPNYQPKINSMPESGAILPCYRIARR